MTLLLQFLQKLVVVAPTLIDVIEGIVNDMLAKGELTEDEKIQLVMQIRPSQQSEIDARIDQQIAERFPKDD